MSQYEIIKTRRDGFAIDSDQVSSGITLADAIRDAGIRCETCEHWEQSEKCTGPLHIRYNGELTTEPGFFCAHHSALSNSTQDIE